METGQVGVAGIVMVALTLVIVAVTIVDVAERSEYGRTPCCLADDALSWPTFICVDSTYL